MAKVSDSCKIKVLAIQPIPAYVVTFDNSLVRRRRLDALNRPFSLGANARLLTECSFRKESVAMGRAMIDFGRFAQLCGHWAIEGCHSLCMEPASPQNESPVASRFPL